MTYFELPAPELGISGFDNGTVAYLEEQGYNITYQGEAGSTSHVIIRFPNGMYEAASDPRKVRTTFRMTAACQTAKLTLASSATPGCRLPDTELHSNGS
jgi:hypothetical protein